MRRHIAELKVSVHQNQCGNLVSRGHGSVISETIVKNNEERNFDRIYSNTKLMCSGVALITVRLRLRKKNQNTWGRDSVTEESKDSRRFSMHIVFQEEHDILKSRDTALEPSPV
jgi:hypothetical protein